MIKAFPYFLLCGLLSLWQTDFLSADDLPSDCAELLMKLEQFKQETRQGAENAILEKRAQAAGILSKHLQNETRVGNLDSAVAIQKAIDSLSQPNSFDAYSPSDDMSKQSEEVIKIPELEWFVGKKWAVVGSNFVFAFYEDSTGMKFHESNTLALRWKVLESGVVEVTGGSSPEYFWFDSAESGEKTAGPKRMEGRPLEIRGPAIETSPEKAVKTSPEE